MRRAATETSDNAFLMQHTTDSTANAVLKMTITGAPGSISAANDRNALRRFSKHTEYSLHMGVGQLVGCSGGVLR